MRVWTVIGVIKIEIRFVIFIHFILYNRDLLVQDYLHHCLVKPPIQQRYFSFIKQQVQGRYMIIIFTGMGHIIMICSMYSIRNVKMYYLKKSELQKLSVGSGVVIIKCTRNDDKCFSQIISARFQ